jgi:Cu2+-exporting ATPase
LVSGESKPAYLDIDKEVIAGSICLDGSVEVIITRTGEHSTVGKIKALIEQAQGSKPRAQRLADRAASILTFVAVSVAISSFLIWSLWVGESLAFSITLAITVLVIACPHALGLAIPAVSAITTSIAVKNGIFIKDLSKIELVDKIQYIVFDKTGTLTEGKFGVEQIQSLDPTLSSKDILRIVASLEEKATHNLSHAIVEKARTEHIKLKSITQFKNYSGKGITGTIDDKTYSVGNQELMRAGSVKVKPIDELREKFEIKGSIILVGRDEELIGLIGLTDQIKKQSYETVNKLHDQGIKIVLLTGDNTKTAEAVAKELNIDKYFAEVLPEDKYKYIRKLQADGSKVMMVGDGVNDAPALTQADVGVAVGAGADVAVEAGDIILTKSDPKDILTLVKLARRANRKISENLIWALGYNIVAIPAAAGAFAHWGLFLRPDVGALMMSLSSVIVVINAFALRRYFR